MEEKKKVLELLEMLKNDESWEEDADVRAATIQAFERVLASM